MASNSFLLSWHLWLLIIGFSLLSLVDTYGFSKCTQYELDIHHVFCIRKKITNLTDAISDIPGYTTHLNLTQNQIQVIPPYSFTNLTALVDLRLEWNSIWKIGKRAFWGLENLTLLNLVENKIQSVNTSFQGLSNLETLLLSHNQITHIHKNAFVPLVRLKRLSLSRNFISNFSNVLEAVQHLPCLEHLDLTNNSIMSLDHSPTSLVSLTYLSLQGNKLMELNFSVLSLPNLTTLDVSRNSHQAIQNVYLETLPQLKSLNLSGVQVQLEMLSVKHLQNLREIDLSNGELRSGHLNLSTVCHLLRNLLILETLVFQKNATDAGGIKHLANCTRLLFLDLGQTSDLVDLNDSEFNAMPSLQRLHLNKCQLSFVSNRTWSSLQNLTALDLSHNMFNSFPDFAFSPLKCLQSLSLSRNPITELNNMAFKGLNSLKELNLAGCWIVAIDRNSFAQFPNLERLDLGDNNIRTVKRKTFQSLKKLQVLILSKNRLEIIQSSAFFGLTYLHNLDLAYNSLPGVSVDFSLGFENLKVLNLGFNKITYETTKTLHSPPFMKLKSLKQLNLEGQTHGIQVVPTNFFKGLNGLEELRLGKNPIVFLDHLQFDPLINLTKLDISGTKDGDRSLYLNTSLFKKLKRLKMLRLENNNLESLTPGMFSGLESLQVFSLRFNNLKIINQSHLENLKSLMYFDLYGNKLQCNCDNVWFKNWSTNTPNVHIPYLRSYSCQQPNTQSLLVDFDDTLCNFDLGKVYFFFSFSLVLTTMLFSWFSSKLASSLRYGFYIFRAWYLAKWYRTEKKFIYDAFVSFTATDEQWVYKELVPALEEGGKPTFKLCLHHRDFEPGTDIFENIQNAINTSRKTLCVVSNHYLHSEWCRLEIQLASIKMFYDHEDVIILIFLEEIPNYKLSSYHRLRKLVNRQTFITWPQNANERPLFWARIRNALGNKTVEKDNAQLIVAE
ncbi:toll-like receptor 13 [Tupaia chinensis]|uniref:Toll-like receptor 13 n=1 Tax=Tupaia chinensis TaxID=246437 RepID=L9KTT2_TUPCH|nr:toll-like receptor 13 [Tupaia chinensis]XP_027627770.1 toll-like receptor 13 [Tupaia chinensis]XP_027627771.1 toll-like receptor 13 [Tupaia chinensis]XP_027627772.1 toll-like receptor 13 [Tupaia chinensis]ELW65894.1 Toll-like receptor 13 [Tupaia chinensis]